MVLLEANNKYQLIILYFSLSFCNYALANVYFLFG